MTVVIPAYNAAQYIGQTLDAIFEQDYAPLEVIVVDDGSTDDTSRVVREFDSKRVTYVCQQNSGGPAAPRNRGIREAKGRYIALVDADDLMLPGKLARSVSLLTRQPSLGFVFADFAKFDDAGGQYPARVLDNYPVFRKLPKVQVGEAEFVIRADSAYTALILENFVGLSSVVMPREVFEEVGMFDESIAGPEDFDLWLRVTRRYDIGFINMVGHRYRVRPGSITSRGDMRLIPHKITILQKHLVKDQTDPVRHMVRKRLAQELWALGYCHQISGAMELARQHYLRSLKEGQSWLAWKGLLMTLVGARAIALLKQCRDFVSGGMSGTGVA